MQGLFEFLTSIYTYIKSLLGIDFSAYAGNLPQQFIDYYNYVDTFIKYVCLFFFLYMCFNFLYFLFSMGGIRK